MTNKYNHQGHNSLIVAIISWILLFSSCEIAWAENECGPLKSATIAVICDSTENKETDHRKNIEYKGLNGLELISEGITLKTKHDKDNYIVLP